MKLRPLVQKFAEEMEKRLRENDHKGGEFEDEWEIFERIYEEIVEVSLALRHFRAETDVGECADVANFCAMLAAWGKSDWPWVNDREEEEEE